MTYRETMIAKLGSEEAYREWHSRNGKKGGSAKVKKGFAKMTPEKRKAAASKGGKVTSSQ